MNENNIFVKKKKKSIHKNNILKKRGFKMKCEMGRHTAKNTARIPKSNHHFEEPKKKSRAARTILHHSAKPNHCYDQRSMPATTPHLRRSPVEASMVMLVDPKVITGSQLELDPTNYLDQ
jgi:hypothetical protein